MLLVSFDSVLAFANS